jgi:protocatechuate 3,4-dioxygenase beta subunit
MMVMVGAALTAWQGQQARDPGGAAATQAPARTGTGVLAGVVVSDDASAQPIRRATVTVAQDASLVGGRTAVTDDAGRFAIGDLPAGRYLVTAAKAAYLAAAYGATRPLRPGSVRTGTAVDLEDGQRITTLSIRMMRGSVITGVVRDQNGKPARAVIGAYYYRRSTQTGERQLQPATRPEGGPTQTDSRGVYRIFGLTPGDYVITAAPVFGVEPFDLAVATDAELSRAMAPRGNSGIVPPPPAPRRTVGFVPVFYPGTTDPSSAVTISIGPAEERSGVDLQLQLVPNSRIEGTVVGPDGQPVAGAMVRATVPTVSPDFAIGSLARTDAQGHYTLSGLPPSSYTIASNFAARPPAGSTAGLTSPIFAMTSVVVQAEDQHLDFTLQPVMSLSGRIEIDAQPGMPPPADLSRIRLALFSDASSPTPFGISTPAVVDVTGRFSLPVIPGRYRISGSPPGAAPLAGWTLKSVVVGGQDAADRAAEIRTGADITDAVVTITNRLTEFSGAMVDAAGRPAPDYFVIAFSTDRTQWIWQSRRIQQVRPARDGTFAFKGLPPGEYYIGAVTDVDFNEWFEPEFLASIVGAAFKITLAEGEKKTQRIQVR